jgi:hypothetical protein
MTKKAPQKAKRPCLVNSCKEYATNQGYCDNHQDKIKRKTESAAPHISVAMMLNGLKLVMHSLMNIRYALNATRLVTSTQQQSLTISFHTRAIRFCSGIRATGSRYVKHTTTSKPLLKIGAVGRQFKPRPRQIKTARTISK